MIWRGAKQPVWQPTPGEGRILAAPPDRAGTLLPGDDWGSDDWAGDDWAEHHWVGGLRWAWSGDCINFTFKRPLPPGSYRLAVDIKNPRVARPQCILGTHDKAHAHIKLHRETTASYTADFAITEFCETLYFAPDDLPAEASSGLKWSNLKLYRMSKLDFYLSAIGFFWHILRQDPRLLRDFVDKAFLYLRDGKAPPSIPRKTSRSMPGAQSITGDHCHGMSVEEQTQLQADLPDTAWVTCDEFPGFKQLVGSEIGHDRKIDADDTWLVPDLDDFKQSPLLRSRLADVTEGDGRDITLVTFDDILRDAQGDFIAPFYRPDWSPTYLQSWNYVGAAYAIRAKKLRQLSSFLGTANPKSLLQQAAACVSPSDVQHLPDILGCWKILAGQDDPRLRLWPAKSKPVLPCSSKGPSVDILIPTRNRIKLLKACVESIEQRTDYPNFRLLIIDNGSDDPEALAFLEAGHNTKRFAVLREEGPFNYSALNNRAAEQCGSDYLLLLNNDTTICNEDWLAQMVQQAEEPGVGAVGAKLYYPNGRIQHGGLVMSLCSSVAGHLFKQVPSDDTGYFGSLTAPHEVGALTGACFLIKRALYNQLGGLDEAYLAVAYNDVDLSLKIRQAGYRLVWTPWAELIHHESVSRGRREKGEQALRAAREVDVMRRRWGAQLRIDPYFSSRLSRDHLIPVVQRTSTPS